MLQRVNADAASAPHRRGYCTTIWPCMPSIAWNGSVQCIS
jgi:hypothetical protein